MTRKAFLIASVALSIGFACAVVLNLATRPEQNSSEDDHHQSESSTVEDLVPVELPPELESISDQVNRLLSTDSDPVMGTSESSSDAVWGAFPRTRFPLWPTILDAAVDIEFEELPRHVELNPRDLQLSAEQLSSVNQLWLRFHAVFEQVLQARGAVTAREMKEKIDAGETVVRELGKSGSPSIDYGREFVSRYRVTKRDGDRMHFASYEMLPNTRAAIEYEQYVASEFALRLLPLFLESGCLSNEECVALVRLVDGG